MIIKQIKPNNLKIIQRIGKLRAEVWTDEGHLLPEVCKEGIWLDELDDRGKHWAVFHQDEIVGAARLTSHNSLENMPHAHEFSPYNLAIGLPYCFMSRLVVRKDMRSQGLARQLDCLRLQETKQSGAKAVIILPTSYRVKSLLKLGFLHFGVSGVLAKEMADLNIQTHVMVHYLEKLHQFY